MLYPLQYGYPSSGITIVGLKYNKRGVKFDSIEFSPITKYTSEFYNLINHAKSRNGIKLIAPISKEDLKINMDIIECYDYLHST